MDDESDDERLGPLFPGKTEIITTTMVWKRTGTLARACFFFVSAHRGFWFSVPPRHLTSRLERGQRTAGGAHIGNYTGRC